MLPLIDIDPFSSRNLIHLPEIDDNSSNTWSGFRFEAGPRNELLKLAAPRQSASSPFSSGVFRLDLVDVQLPNLESSTQSPFGTPDDEEKNEDIEEKSLVQEQEDDFWKAPSLLLHLQQDKLVSWDHFTDQSHEESACTFISEADPRVFDLLLQKILPKSHNDQTKYAKPDVLISALVDLGLGRSSVMFRWNEQSQRFDTVVENYTKSGISRKSFQHMADQFLDAGAQFRRIRRFGEGHKRSTPARITLQTTIQSIVDVIEENIESSRDYICSLIRLQDSFHVPLLLLDIFDRLVKEVRSIEDNVDIIVKVIDWADEHALTQSRLVPVMQAMVSRMLQPSFVNIQATCGMTPQTEALEVNQERLLSRVSSVSTVETYNQTVKTLGILQEHEYDSTLLWHEKGFRTSLSLTYSLQDISALQLKASGHERKHQERIVLGSVHALKALQLVDDEQEDFEKTRHDDDPFAFQSALFSENMSLYGSDEVAVFTKDPSMRARVTTALTANIDLSLDTLLSSCQAIEFSISPMIKVQHRLLSYSVLRLLFCEHDFVSHMRLLGRFQLLTDGTFSSKLSIALYDPEQASGEGRRMAHGKTGLRLQSREAWPPATSELRLALMGILSESMSHIKDISLTESISFAIKDLADEDLERCRDIDSIYALDFLRLNYKPPNSCIEAVITPQSPDKYDAIFNQLMRLLRMKSLARSMLRQSGTNASQSATNSNPGEHKFRVEIQHFIASLAEYYTDTVIKTTWLLFEAKLTRIHESLRQGDYTGTLNLSSGLDHLQALHETALDAIMRGLLLKRRQSEPRGIIDRLFEVILRFAATSFPSRPTPVVAGRNTSVYTKNQDDDAASSNNVKSKHLRKDFAVHMRALVSWLRVEVGRGGESDGRNGDPGAFFEQLLLKLDWNGYWSR